MEALYVLVIFGTGVITGYAIVQGLRS